jgi:hypothetical protein
MNTKNNEIPHPELILLLIAVVGCLFLVGAYEPDTLIMGIAKTFGF